MLVQNIKKNLESKNRETRIISILSYLILFIGIIFLIRYQIRLLNLVEWGDESETIIVTKMMAQGYRLYTEVYNNHGPLVFFPGLIISSIGNFGIHVYRIPIMILQLIALLSIFCSPIFKNKNYRNFYTLIAGTIMVIFLPRLYGHTYMYQVYSGLFFLIVLVQYTLPNYLDIKVKPIIVLLSSFILFSIPFLAVTNLPMVILILVSSFRRRDAKYLAIGGVASLIFNLGFLLTFGSWDGYIAYHYYLNFKVLYNNSGVLNFVLTIFNYYTKNFYNFISLCLIMISLAHLNKYVKNSDYWRTIFVIPMFMSLVIRGGEFYSLYGLIYVYALIGLGSILFISEFETNHYLDLFHELPVVIFSIVCLIVLYLPIQTENYYYELTYDTHFSRIAKKITTPDEKVLALTFRSYEYLASDRLPASTHFIYLSIQAKYNQKPYKNVYVNIVDDVKKNKPKIILMDKWNIIIDETDIWDNYASDLVAYISANYYRLQDSDIYIRNDINLTKYNLDPTFGTEIE